MSKIAYPADDLVTEPANSLFITHSTTRKEDLSLKLVCIKINSSCFKSHYPVADYFKGKYLLV